MQSSGFAPAGHSVALPVSQSRKVILILLVALAIVVGLLAGTTLNYVFNNGKTATFTSNSNGTWNVTTTDGAKKVNVPNGEAASLLDDFEAECGGIQTCNGIPPPQAQT